MKSLYVITGDTETTGFEAETNSLVEIAFVGEDQMSPFEFCHTLVKPTTPITFGAMATHHITEAMVANAPDVDQAFRDVHLDPEAIAIFGDNDIEPILTFHNAEFDRAFLPPHLQELRYICTWRCAMALFPDAESHKNGALWYELGLERPMPPEAGSMPHRGLFDALMTRDLLNHLADHVSETNPNVGSSLEHLIWLSQQAVLLKTVGFGKHRGDKWADLPVDYMQWCLRQDMSKDIHFTCNHWIQEYRRG